MLSRPRYPRQTVSRACPAGGNRDATVRFKPMTALVDRPPDLERIASLIRRAAEECILPRFCRLASHEVREKSPGNLVTIADEEAERRLAELLSDAAPGAVVIGEEAVARRPPLIDHLLGDGPAWIVDPIDGTHNFAHGRADFAVIVAYAACGKVQAGWIHDPVDDVTAFAAVGEGAWRLAGDGGRRRLAVASNRPLSALEGVLLGRLPGGDRARDVAAASSRLGPVRYRGSSGQVYLSLAEGALDYAYFSRALPWDHAAGLLIHAEAGGHGGFFDGNPYSPQRHQGPLLAAPDRQSWHAIRHVLENVKP